MPRLLALLLLVLLLPSSRAALLSFGGGAIPDAQNGGLVGVSFQGAVSGLPASPDEILQVNVALQISGGYNFDFYVYLVSPNGTLVNLINQPGSAFSSGSGFDITLADSAAGSIQSTSQSEGVPVTGTYQAASSLAAFNGGPANGTWTLYIQDLSPGASGTLDSWGLDITSVPEPTTSALAMFTALLGAGWLTRQFRRCFRRSR